MEAGHKEEGWHVAGLKPREVTTDYDLFEDMLGATHAHVTGISAAGKDEEEEKRKRRKRWSTSAWSSMIMMRR